MSASGEMGQVNRDMRDMADHFPAALQLQLPGHCGCPISTTLMTSATNPQGQAGVGRGGSSQTQRVTIDPQRHCYSDESHTPPPLQHTHTHTHTFISSKIQHQIWEDITILFFCNKHPYLNLIFQCFFCLCPLFFNELFIFIKYLS